MATTAQQIIESHTLPEGFEYDAIGFTADGWVLTAPNGAEFELGTFDDNPEGAESYTWQTYDTDGAEGGNIIDCGGTSSEDEARGKLTAFIHNN